MCVTSSNELALCSSFVLTQSRMKEYFDRIQKLVEGHKMAARIKFMLQDLCLLKKVCVGCG